MCHFMAKFVIISGICKDYSGNRVHTVGRVACRGVLLKFVDLGFVVLGITAEAFGFECKNDLSPRLYKNAGVISQTWLHVGWSVPVECRFLKWGFW